MTLTIRVALALTLVSLSANAQTTAQNVAKYHDLRARLLTEFTVVGDQPGQSQPADVRDDGEGFIKWADSTIRLGWYLGVLATEHHIVTHAGEYPGAAGAENTLDELYYALLALERLDQVADAAFPPPCTATPALNGFFLRDDVPQGFHQNFPPLTTTYSDFVDPVLTNKEMSQDQVYHVLIGLALVKRFVPAGVTVQGRELKPWAIEQARRIIEHVSKDAWVIRNPACGDREVERGPLASGFSGGTRLAIGFITDGEFVPDTAPAYLDIWKGARSPSFAVYLDIDNLHMAMAIASVGNGWGDTTADDLALLAEEPDWPLYPLLHRALHGDAAGGWCRTAETVNARAKIMLDELPAGADIASPKPAALAPHGFTRSNRFMRDKQTAYTGEPGSDGYRFNGLDYLLLHNLYAVATPNTWEGGSGPGIPECTSAGDGGASDAGSGGSSGSAGASGASGGGEDDDGGCGCRVPARRGHDMAWLALGALGIAVLCRRRSWRTSWIACVALCGVVGCDASEEEAEGDADGGEIAAAPGTCRALCCASTDCASGESCEAFEASGALGACSGTGSSQLSSSGALPAGCWTGSQPLCDPVSNDQCEDADVCEFRPSTDPEFPSQIACTGGDHSRALGQTCDDTRGPWCALGLRCVPDQS